MIQVSYQGPDGNGGAEVARVTARFAVEDALRREELDRLCRFRVVARGRLRGPPSRPRLRLLALCTGPGCSRVAKGDGLCITHHRQMQRRGWLGPIRAYGIGGAPCPTTGCRREVVVGGVCRTCYERARWAASRAPGHAPQSGVG